MAVTTYIASSAGTTTAALPAGTASGDIVVVYAYSSTATTPTLPASWTNITSNAATPATRMAYRVYDGVWTMPTFTSAAQCHAVTIRGQDTTSPIGVTSITNGNSSNPVFPAVTLVDTDGSSQLLRGINHTRPDSVMTAPTGHTSRQASGTQPGWITMTKTDTSTGATATVTVSRNTTWTQSQVEIKCASAQVQQATAVLVAISTLTSTATKSTPAVFIDPRSLSGLLFWLDATTLTGNDGDLLPTWRDSSDNGFPATQYASDAVYNTAGINGHPAIRFGQTGVTEMRVNHDHTVSDRTIFQVVKNIGQYGSFATTQLQGGDPYLQTYSTSGTIHTYTTPDLDSGVAWSGACQFVTLWCDATAATQGLEVDRVKVTSGWTPGASSSSFQIGANSVASYGMNGWVGEVVIYERCLTDTERAEVQDYLTTKWMDVGGPVIQDATAALVATSTLTVTATAFHVLSATAALTATSTLTATAVRAPQGTAALTATSTLTATAVREQTATASLTATSTLSTVGVREPQATTALTATSTLSATADRTVVVAAALTATSTLTSTALGIGVAQGAAVLTAVSTLTATAVREQTAAAALTATSTLTGGAVRAPQAAAALTATSTLVVAADRTAQVSAALTATSTLTATATVIGVGLAAATFTATSTLTATATRIPQATAALTASSTLTATAVRTQLATAALTATSTLSAAGVREPQAAAVLTATSTLTAAAVREQNAVAALTATSTLTATATAVGVGLATVGLTATSTLTATATRGQAATAALVAVSTLTADATRGQPAAAALTAKSTLSTTGERQRIVASALIATSTLTVVGVRELQARATLLATSTLTVMASQIKAGGGIPNVALTGTLHVKDVDGQWYPLQPVGWHPTMVPGLVAWIDATQDGFADGAPITSYIEHSPAHRVFIASNPPTFRASSVGGKPRIEFAGSGMYCDNVDLGASGLTYVMVHQTHVPNSYQMMWTCTDPGHGYEMRHSSISFQTQVVCDYTDGGPVFSQTATMAPDIDFLNMLRLSSSGARLAEHWQNNSSRVTAPMLPFMASGPYRIRIGFREDGYYFNGLVAEAMAFAGPVSDADRDKLASYLNKKWHIW